MGPIIDLAYQKTPEDALALFRQKGWEQWQTLGTPHPKLERYRYLPLRKLFQWAPQESQVEAPPKADIVIIDGKLQECSLPQSIICMSLSEAMRPYRTILQNHWNQAIKEEKDHFAHLNTALQGDGVFLYIPPKTVCPHIRIINLSSSHTHSRLHIRLGQEAQGTITYTAKGTGFCNHVTECSLDQQATLTFQQTPQMDTSSFYFDAFRATLKKDSTLHAIHNLTGTVCTRHDYHVILTGTGADANLSGLWRLNDKLEAHTHVLVDHQAPHCTSMQHFKGILDDVSRSSFEGKILVRKEAQQTNAYQMNPNLILSEGAQANCKPNLEIFADDVKASHGATVGQLDPEHLFYLEARGIDKKQAKHLLTEAFAREITDKLL
ncbi:MAG: Fe-S cluster assembly protein SufD [Chlamydiia bacterium]|nr:Fe-S cluster assembly protein SufD [Chlamydiia bacterium]